MTEKLTLQSIFLETCRKWPERPALGSVGTPLRTYSEVLGDAAGWAEWFTSLGMKQGDRVAILAESRAEWGAVYFGAVTAGFAAVPILPDFAPAQVAHILEHSESSAAVVSERSTASMNKALEMSETLTSSFPIARMNDGLILSGASEGQTIQPSDRPDDVFHVTVQPGDMASLLYTSGTTGTSKGVMLSHNAIARNAVTGYEAGLQGNYENMVALSVLPLAHTYECTVGLVGMVAYGGQTHYLDGPPTPSRLLKALSIVRPSIMLTVPLLMEKIFRSRISGPIKSKPVLRKLYKLPPMRWLIHQLAGKKVKQLFGGRLRFYGIGGAPLPGDVERFLRDAKFPYSVGYGLTETAPLLAGGDPRLMSYRSTGTVLKDVTIRIHDPNAEGVGEIQALSPSVMLGYWNDEERTKAAFTEDGWFRTGDLGMFAKGKLFIKGRLKDVLLGSNGENIYPDEVETVLNGQNLVAESLAYIMDGRLVARILLDTEKISAEITKRGLVGTERINEWKNEMMDNIRKEANKHLGRNSRIHAFIEQTIPFEKTPSLKIKRFLYTGA
ncbi:MAG: AMP-binding protein [Spirochaetales bacterium]|nr:AMP-binding protein [Spirochaetales bacterium]